MIAEMDHGMFAQLAAGAALDDLDVAEREELDRHLPSCTSCRGLLADLQDFVGDLAVTAPPRQPPASLLRDILSALRLPNGAFREF